VLRRLCIPLCCALIVALFAVTFGSASADSLSQKDNDLLSVTKVIPGTGQYILTPSKFIYTVTVSYSLRTSKTGTLSMEVFRLNGSRKELLAMAPRMQIVQGDGNVLLQSTEVFIRAGARTGPGGLGRLKVIVSLASSEGKDLAFWSSENVFTGELSAEYKDTVSSNDYIQVLSVQPSPGTFLQAGVKSPFEIKFAYNVASITPAYTLFLFSNVSSVNDMVYMRIYYIPVPRGRGIMTARIPIISLPAAKRGDTVGIKVAFFNNATNRTLSTSLIWPYNLTR